jgi:energy-coupling factor transporter ATP-binding protein EcfA2
MEFNKTILYGRNAQGKSTILRALLFLIVRSESFRRFLLPELERDPFGEILFRKSGIKLCTNDRCVSSSNPGLLDDVRLSRIVGGTIYIITRNRKGDIESYIFSIYEADHLKSMLRDPEVVEVLEEFFRWLEPPIEDYYLEYFREPGSEWLNIVNLAYGYRRALMFLYALEKSDIVTIEGFEGCLHIDLMKYILQYINTRYRDKLKVILIETHNGLPVVYGLNTGWTVYYVTRNNIVKLQSYRDLLDKAELFLKELEVIQFEVPP